jgi:RNA polymerase sigma-70 factor (ECF subfamily)
LESDERLFERLRAGDLAAFDELYARFERPLFGFILGFVDDRAEAEDVFHETFLAMLRWGPARAEAVGSARAWLYRVARNLCLNRLRKQTRGRRALAGAGPVAEAAAGPDAEVHLETGDREEALRRAVERLPEHLGAVYRLRAAGMSYNEIADALAVPVGTVKSRIHEMIERLQQEMRSWTAR